MAKTKDKFFGKLESLTEDNVVETLEETVEETSNETEVQTTEATSNEITVKPTFTDVCLGLARDENGRVRLYEIPFDPILNIAGEVTKTAEEFMDNNHAQEAFKIAVIRKGIFK